MLLSEFDYELPEELIAQVPCTPRNASRLMVVDSGRQTIQHSHFYDLKNFLRPGDLLVFNDTRVMPARLFGVKEDTGARAEILLLKRLAADKWEVLARPGKRLKSGSVIKFSDDLSCTIVEDTDFGGKIIKFSYQGIFEEILDRLGQTPLPPYIKTRLEDKERYQTVYAREQGSAAAPTAGLHFTVEMLRELESLGIELAFVTLHVGLGTFRPVDEDVIEEHKMHEEFYSVNEETAAKLNRARQEGRRVIAVGTTSVRTLESAASGRGRVEAGSAWTGIFIYPGYEFKMVDAMVTNFHLPKSTLLMLISAFAGKDMVFKAYAEAISQRYRFFSFGDAMLLLPDRKNIKNLGAGV